MNRLYENSKTYQSQNQHQQKKRHEQEMMVRRLQEENRRHAERKQSALAPPLGAGGSPRASQALVIHSSPPTIDLAQQRMIMIQYILNTIDQYPEWNIHYYRNHNPDIIHLNQYQLTHHWNHIGRHQRETWIYNKESLLTKKPTFYREHPIYVFIHVCSLHNGVEIFYDQLKAVIESGLYEACKNVIVGVVGPAFPLPTQQLPKIVLLYQDKNPKHYEVKTINYIQQMAEHLPEGSRIMYIHTKGVRKNGDARCVQSWRKMMEYWAVQRYDIALQYLTNYDTYGCNILNMCPSRVYQYLYAVNPTHFFHYSGNFWWARREHIMRLPVIQHSLGKQSVDTRLRAENWVLSAMPKMKPFEVYYNKRYVHAYDTYCEPGSYHKPWIEVFTGRNRYEDWADDQNYHSS